VIEPVLPPLQRTLTTAGVPVRAQQVELDHDVGQCNRAKVRIANRDSIGARVKLPKTFESSKGPAFSAVLIRSYSSRCAVDRDRTCMFRTAGDVDDRWSSRDGSRLIDNDIRQRKRTKVGVADGDSIGSCGESTKCIRSAKRTCVQCILIRADSTRCRVDRDRTRIAAVAKDIDDDGRARDRSGLIDNDIRQRNRAKIGVANRNRV
jgi:hypothetical protein